MITVQISRNVILGKNCEIHNSSVIGNIGFGYNRNNGNILERKEHNYGVIINDNVDIAALCNIDKGSWRYTEIGDGTKIDALTHIAHNVIIGKNCLIGTGVRILGSVTIGDNCEIWANSVINQRIKIGRNVIIGACSYVRHDIPDNELWYGNPARKIRMTVKCNEELK